MLIDVAGLHFSYGARSVLKEIEFQLAEGELLAILGPNGAGKTTLLKCLNAIVRPQRGSINIGSRDLYRLRPNEIALAIGYVPQRIDRAQLTVFDAVLLGRKPYIRWRAKESDLKIVESALRHLGLEEMALRHLDHLSGGELQKVAIARALVQEPSLLLLDEPTSALDLKSQVEVLDMIRSVVDGHKIGAVMTMHDLNTALRYADRFLFLKQGEVRAFCGRDQVTAAIVEDVYGVPVHIQDVQGCPVVVPLRSQEDFHHELSVCG
jgi:iron complex transport system ATP-binding protein